MKWMLSRIIPVIFCVLFFTQSLYSVDDCSICMEPLDDQHGEVVCLDCDRDPDSAHPHHCHKFHRDCIERALNMDAHRKCPLCRAQNCVILPLPPEPLSFIDHLNQQAHSLWQARNAALAGAASALVGVPYVKGTIACGIVGVCRPGATIQTAWYYPGAFSIGYCLATIYAMMVKRCLREWTAIPNDAPFSVYAPLLPVLCFAAGTLWHNS